jgi:hypothetical protein
MKKTVKINCEIAVPFHSYENKRLDEKAKKQITSYVKEIFEDECYFPINVEYDENSELYDDFTDKVKVKVNSEWS